MCQCSTCTGNTQKKTQTTSTANSLIHPLVAVPKIPNTPINPQADPGRFVIEAAHFEAARECAGTWPRPGCGWLLALGKAILGGCIPISNWPIINRIISYIMGRLWVLHGFTYVIICVHVTMCSTLFPTVMQIQVWDHTSQDWGAHRPKMVMLSMNPLKNGRDSFDGSMFTLEHEGDDLWQTEHLSEAIWNSFIIKVCICMYAIHIRIYIYISCSFTFIFCFHAPVVWKSHEKTHVWRWSRHVPPQPAWCRRQHVPWDKVKGDATLTAVVKHPFHIWAVLSDMLWYLEPEPSFLKPSLQDIAKKSNPFENNVP